MSKIQKNKKNGGTHACCRDKQPEMNIPSINICNFSQFRPGKIDHVAKILQ
jgi:hypothetical protein